MGRSSRVDGLCHLARRFRAVGVQYNVCKHVQVAQSFMLYLFAAAMVRPVCFVDMRAGLLPEVA